MEALMALVSIPLMILNLLGGIVGGIWLVVLGEWRMVLFGLGYAVFGTYLISIALLPGMVLAAPAAAAERRNNSFLTLVLGFPSLLWTYALLFGSCFLFLAYAARVHEGTIIPYLLWAYATALGPWTHMAKKEQQLGNEYSLYSVSGAQLGTMLGGIALLMDPTDYSLERLWLWMAPGLLFAVLLQSTQIYVNTRAYRRY